MGLYGKFAEHYDLIYKTMVNYEKETDDLEKIFKKFCERKPKSVLDIGCGTGSHSLLLSKRGYHVAGIDISERMVEEARRKAKEEKADVEFFVQDMRKIDLNKKFDCAICMFGGFGYVLTNWDLAKVFSGLKRHLEENGLFIFEFWSVGGVRPSPNKSWLKIKESGLTLYRLSESDFDPLTNVLIIDFHFIEVREHKAVKTFDETHKIRCYTLPEMRKYLEENSFELVAAYDWDVKDVQEFKTPGRETFRILAVAKKN
jgi:SAM-dependent methyltransferase